MGNHRHGLMKFSKGIAWLGLCLPLALQAQTPTVTLVHGFSGPDGTYPASDLIELPNGNLMGITWNPQTSPATGEIYRLDAMGTIGTVAPLAGTTQCGTPLGYDGGSSLFQASSGLVYGVCYSGGAYGLGSIYAVSPMGTVHVLHSFSGSDGSHPLGPLVEGVNGDLYGVTRSTVFRITPAGVLTLLQTFVRGSGAYVPVGGLTLGSDENLYGVTELYGNSYYGGAYKIDSTGAYSVLGHYYASAYGLNPVVTSSNAVETLCQPTVSVAAAAETLESVDQSGTARVVYALPTYFGSDFVNLVGGLVQGGDGAVYLNGASIIVDPVNPTVAARIDVTGKTTQFAAIDSSIGSVLVGNPLQTASGAIYSAAQTGGPNGLGSVLSVDYGNPAPSPGILFFAPSSASAPTVVTLWGSHFVGATSVTVGGQPVPFTTVASGFIKFSVTKNAMTGPITVTTAGGTVTSAGTFTVE